MPMMTGVSAIMAIRGTRFWIKGTRAALAVVVAVAGGFAVWYRAAYHAWPGLEPTRVHWCGRDYQAYPGPPQTWPQITSRERWPVRQVGWYPPVWPQQELFAARIPDAQRFSSSPPVVCAVVIFLRAGLDEYKVYTLEGGP
jgi:hypothetical protein